MTKSSCWFTAPLLALLCAALFVANVAWRPAEFALLAEVKTDAPAQLELRYTRDYGFRRDESVVLSVPGGSEGVGVRFPIESRSLRNLRLKADGCRVLQVRAAKLKPLGRDARFVTLADFSAADSSTRVAGTAAGDVVLSSDTSSAVTATILSSLRIKSSRIARVIPGLMLIALAGAAVALLRSLANADECMFAQRVAHGISRARAVVIAILIGSYILASVLNLNGSSTALWRKHVDRQEADAGIIAGTPKDVRADEWMLQTPWIFSQAAQTRPFSTTNAAIGCGHTPLVLNLPVRHWSTIFRPQMWPFFIMSVERAFAFYWNFKVFGLLLGAVLFFGVLTGGKTLLDLSGALFLTFSPYVQWWFSTATCMPEMLAMFLLAMWLVTVILRANTRRAAVLAALCLVFAIANFVFCCYPRFQIPLVYLAGSLAAGGFAAGAFTRHFRRRRVWLLASAIAAAGFIILLWWQDVAPVIHATSFLSYPGKVRSTGGDFAWHRLLAPFLEFSMTEQRLPSGFANVCEAAGFIFLAPLLVAVAIRDCVQGRRDPIAVSQLSLLAATLCFMLVGVPAWLAHLSAWEYVYSTRAILLLGVATTILLVRYLSVSPGPTIRMNLRGYGYFAAATLLFILVLRRVNTRLGQFETLPDVAAVALFFCLFGVCVWRRYATSACILLVLPQVYSCALINPISRGLPGLTQSKLLPWIAAAHKRQPEAKWIVLGESGRAQVLPELVKASGAHALDGVHCNPDYSMLAVLDPTAKYADIYNRYALIRFRAADVVAPVVRPGGGLSYDIEMRMQPELLDQLGVGYILEVDTPAETPPVSGFHEQDRRDGIRLLVHD